MNNDLAVAKLLYVCYIPFPVVKCPSFKNLIHVLRWSYEPPSHKEMADCLSDAIHSEINGLVAANLKLKKIIWLIMVGAISITNQSQCLAFKWMENHIIKVEKNRITKKATENCW